MDPREALSQVETHLRCRPTPEQLNMLHNRVHDWLIEAKYKDGNTHDTVGKCSAPYEWLMGLVNRVMEKQVSFDVAVQEILEYQKE